MAQLPDELVQQLLENIETFGDRHASAQAEQERLKENRKITKNVLMKFAEADGIKSHVQQEKYAYTHPTYLRAVADWIKSIEEGVKAEVRFRNAEREWESWRTISANQRSVR